MKSKTAHFLGIVVIAKSLFCPTAYGMMADGDECKRRMTGPCLLFLTSSAPTFLVYADSSAMDMEQRKAYVLAEAHNYLQGIPGDYLLLKLVSKSRGLKPNSTNFRSVAESIVSELH